MKPMIPQEGIITKLLNLIMTYKKQLSMSIIYLLIFFALYKFVVIKIYDVYYMNKVVPATLNSNYKMNLESDMNRLECVFEQRRCYFENLGSERNVAVSNCQDINFCDIKFKVKK